LKDHGVPFTEKDVAADDGAMAEMVAVAGGHVGTPVVCIGDTVIKGYDPAKMAAALNL
jgi:glutaredoxin